MMVKRLQSYLVSTLGVLALAALMQTHATPASAQVLVDDFNDNAACTLLGDTCH